jgi:hypothetical protein
MYIQGGGCAMISCSAWRLLPDRAPPITSVDCAARLAKDLHPTIVHGFPRHHMARERCDKVRQDGVSLRIDKGRLAPFIELELTVSSNLKSEEGMR